VRFVRHLVVVCLVVAVVVILGLAWNHFAASSLVGSVQRPRQELVQGTGPAGGRPEGRVVLPGGSRPGGPGERGVVQVGTFDLGLSSMLQPVNWPYLRHTVFIEAAVMAAVVIIDVSRRRSRRASRAARLAQPSSGDGDGDGEGRNY
jgi:hypothetical protein